MQFLNLSIFFTILAKYIKANCCSKNARLCFHCCFTCLNCNIFWFNQLYHLLLLNFLAYPSPRKVQFSAPFIVFKMSFLAFTHLQFFIDQPHCWTWNTPAELTVVQRELNKLSQVAQSLVLYTNDQDFLKWSREAPLLRTVFTSSLFDSPGWNALLHSAQALSYSTVDSNKNIGTEQSNIMLFTPSPLPRHSGMIPSNDVKMHEAGYFPPIEQNILPPSKAVNGRVLRAPYRIIT